VRRDAWTQEVSFEVAGYNDNVADIFLSLRSAVFATGASSVRYASLRYRSLP